MSAFLTDQSIASGAVPIITGESQVRSHAIPVPTTVTSRDAQHATQNTGSIREGGV
jgi:hypothetical protein